MSKTKFALLILALAAGVNIIAYELYLKTDLIEDVKSVWLYELPSTASPVDAYTAIELGPQNGLIGTLGHLNEKWDWDAKAKTITIQLIAGVLFADQTEFSPTYWLSTRDWIRGLTSSWSIDPYWNAYVTANIFWKSPRVVIFSWDQLPASFDPEYFVKHTLASPLTGIIHPKNLQALKEGKKLTKDWISSGPYRVHSWDQTEIVLSSRNDFPRAIPKPHFRTLKFHSSSERKSSYDFMQSVSKEKSDHTLHVFWACRSWREAGSFCYDTENRGKLVKIMTGVGIGNEINKNTKAAVLHLVPLLKETDLELLFVMTDSQASDELAQKMAILSSKLDVNNVQTPLNAVGPIAKFPLQIEMKNGSGDPFSKLFLEP